ncbi:hypothetical protein BV054_00122B, partial [Haemophilus influenzae]
VLVLLISFTHSLHTLMLQMSRWFPLSPLMLP